MQQTLLALLALMVATLLSLTQMQSRLQDQREVFQSEMKEMAIGVATQTLEVVRARAFDENTIGVPEDSITSPSDLTEPPFTTGKHCQAFGGPDTCDDVDDFHQMKPVTVPFETPEFDIDFEVRAEVRYVDASMNPVSTPTFRKEVVFKIQDAGSDPYIQEPITFSEVLTYY
jgi:hypothetical protein